MDIQRSNKTKYWLTIIVLSLFLLMPFIAVAQTTTGGDNLNNPLGSVDSLPAAIDQITNFAVGIAGGIAVLVLIVGGVRYTAAATEDLKEQAKKNITAAVLGAVMVLLAYVIVKFVIAVVGVQ